MDLKYRRPLQRRKQNKSCKPREFEMVITDMRMESETCRF